MKNCPLCIKALIFFTVLLCVGTSLHGQVTYGGVLDTAIDRLGNKYGLRSLAVNDTFRAGTGTIVANKVLTCTSGYFRVFIEQGSGMESDTDVNHIARRTVLCRMLYDLSQFIHSSLTSDSNKINVWIRNPLHVPGTTGLGYATSFFAVPKNPTLSGIADNVAWTSIHTGGDAYYNIVRPGVFPASTFGTCFHIVTAFDFSDYAWHTELSSAPGTTEYDFYSYALNQFAHALGLSSEIAGDGSSLLGASYPYYSRYDQFLTTHNGTPLLSHTGPDLMYGYGFNGTLSAPAVLSPHSLACATDSTTCDTGVMYNGSAVVPVYTPNCFERGYSLSCFEDACFGAYTNNNYFTASNTNNAGSMKRYLKPEERSALCDIGYLTDTTYGDSANLNFYNYGGSSCDGIEVGGVNDPIYPANGYHAIQVNGPGLPYWLSGILDNDVNADAFEDLRVLNGTGSFNATSGVDTTVVIYIPGIADTATDTLLMSYVPYSSSTGRRGSVTYLSGSTSYPVSICLGTTDSFLSVCSCGSGISWISSNTAIATVDTSGVIFPVSVGGPINVYHYGCCTLSVYVVAFPDTITGPDYVCLHSSVGFGDAVGGGHWISSNPSIASVNASTGTVTGVGVGTATITYSKATDVGSCYVTKNITVRPIPVFTFTGPPSVCLGATDTFTASLSGGRWSSKYGYVSFSTDTANPAYVTGAGLSHAFTFTPTIDSIFYTYTDTATHCSATVVHADTILPTGLLPISGNTSLCIGENTLLSVSPYYMSFGFFSGASWTSSNVGVASPDASGYTLGVSSGTAIISYTYTNRCGSWTSTLPIAVHPLPTIAYITPAYICGHVGDMDTLSCSTPGGLWSVSIFYPSVATVSASGVVTIVNDGYTVIYYTVTDTSSGCTNAVSVPVYPTYMSAITGATSVCAGAPYIDISDAVHNGTWYNANPAVANISVRATPFENNIKLWGVAAGIDTVAYVFASPCDTLERIIIITVNAPPALSAIAGADTFCARDSTALSNATPGGRWSSSNAGVAAVSNTGVVTGGIAGTAIITYTVTDMVTHCSSSVYHTVTILGSPTVNSIYGIFAICQGGTSVLGCSTVGGTWRSANPSIAAIDSVGAVRGLNIGQDTIYYTVTNSLGCSAFSKAAITVLAHNPSPIGGRAGICIGGIYTFTDSVGTGTWRSYDTSVATVDTAGRVTGISSGRDTIYYEFTNSCGHFISKKNIIVFPVLGTPDPILGHTSVCLRDTIALYDSTHGGTWSSMDTSVLTIDTSGTAIGIATGSATISYTLHNGCDTVAVSILISVNPLPDSGTISGTDTVCAGSAVYLTDTSRGGIWVSGSTAIATVDTSGAVTGVTGGVVTLSYSVTNSCGTAVDTFGVRVFPLPDAGRITGPRAVCPGDTVSIGDTAYGGTWASSDTTKASISRTGVVTGISTGTAIISYSVSNNCGNATDTMQIKISPLPAAGFITGIDSVCTGAMVTLSDTTRGGTWGSGTTAIATIDTAGIVTALIPGIDTIYYTFTNSCGTEVATRAIHVNQLPDTILGNTSVCLGSSTTLYDSTRHGLWISGSIAITAIGDTSGIISALDTGTAIITYTLATGCYRTESVRVVPLPGRISGLRAVCAGSSITLSDSTADGSWVSGDTSVATVTPRGIVNGIRSGLVVITYELPTGCSDTFAVHVNPLPDSISGRASICIGDTTRLVDSTGGSWVVSDTSVTRIISISGDTCLVTGVVTGSSTITYKLPTGCLMTTVIAVHPLPVVSHISGTDSVCAGSSVTLSDTAAGGVWRSDATAVATIDSTSGITTGIHNGSAVITYTLRSGFGCSFTTTDTIRVDSLTPVPPIYQTAVKICVGDQSPVFDTLPGGTWSMLDTTIATIDATGNITGISGGTTIISYTFRNRLGCTSYDTALCHIMPLPHVAPISGNDTLCRGSGGDFTDSTAGGTWSCSNISIATISSGGHVTALSLGTVVISYAVTDTCTNFAFDTLHIIAPPVIPRITGRDSLCLGSDTVHLSDAVAGGTWSSSDTLVAAINSSGVVHSRDTGFSVITYTSVDRLGCISLTTDTFRVDSIPVVPAFVLHDSVCSHDTLNLTAPIPGGSWSSSDTTIATVTPSGHLYGTGTGSVTVTYSVTSIHGCTGYHTGMVYIRPLPPIGHITGPDTLCVGYDITLVDTFGEGAGYWSTSDTSLISFSTTNGNVHGVAVGTAIVSYSFTDNVTGCHNTATDTLHVVTPVTPPSAITGRDTVCVGSVTALSVTPGGGTWGSLDPTIAIVDGSGNVTGIGSGITVISYTVTTRCETAVRYDTVTVIPSSVTISGYSSVCSGDTTRLVADIGGGTWTTSDPSVASVDPATGVVTGIATGNVIIRYVVGSPCGSDTANYAFYINLQPFITSRTIVACQNLASANYGVAYILSNAGSCILVCDSSICRYYANGISGGVFTWAVTAGTVVANYGDSIDVFWTTPGFTGTITLSDTLSHCAGSSTVCFQVIERPHANFTASATNICLNGSVAFVNHSTASSASPITWQYWDFGDSTGSTVADPTHVFTTSGSHVVTLIVRNRCNCTDTFRMVIVVTTELAPTISCTAVVCENETATYSVSPACGEIWTVTGGTILSGLGTASIQVQWNTVDQSGFGYVDVVNTCSGYCPSITTIKVPVILQSDTITGPAVICVGNQYEYSLPLWGGTRYMWGVPGSPGTIVGYPDDYKMVVNFSTPGTYTIHGWYENQVKLCGANLNRTITVVDNATLTSGNITPCQYDAVTYNISAATADWQLTDPTGAITTGSGSTFTATFTTAGYYLLDATGDFCFTPVTIYVAAAPADIDSMTGADSVCLGRTYTYHAYSDLAGTTYTWSALGGTVTPADGSSTVSVTWNTPGLKKLYAAHTNTDSPFCSGIGFILYVNDAVTRPLISGDTMPCANFASTYAEANGVHAESFQWQVFPDTLGSVVGGGRESSATIFWNNVADTITASVILTIQKCDSTLADTLIVTLIPSPRIIVSATDSVCSGLATSFTPAVIGYFEYIYNFGDGTPPDTTLPWVTETHTFPANNSSGNISYNVLISSIGGFGPGCIPAASGTVHITILPRPVASATFSGRPDICEPFLKTIVTTVTGGVGSMAYLWCGDSVSGTRTGASYDASRYGGYYCVVTAGNGCTDTSNVARFIKDCSGGCRYLIYPAVTSSVSCNRISLSGASGPSPAWQALTPPVGGLMVTGTTTAYADYNVPGIYSFTYEDGRVFLSSDSCEGGFVSDTVGIIPDFYNRMACDTGLSDSVYLTDHSAYLSFWSITSVSWYDVATGSLIGTGNTIGASFPAGTSVTIREVVNGNKPGGTFSCDVVKTIRIPAKGTISFTESPREICEGVPITFTPTATGIVNYFWRFNDSATSLIPLTQRTYTWGGPGDRQRLLPSLTVTDSMGCQVTVSDTVFIRHNLFNSATIIVGPNTVMCSNTLPFVLSILNSSSGIITSYLWSTGDTTMIPYLNVDTSGTYWVTVVDSFQCQFTPATQSVNILKVPKARITGRKNYCFGDDIHLSGFTGNGVSYTWYKDTYASVAGTGHDIAAIVPSIGKHWFRLVTGVMDTATGTTCYDTSTTDTVFVHNLPPTPAFTGPMVVDCNNYHLQLIATDSLPGTFNWSDGNFGATDDIYSGGPYRVWFTDTNGCVSQKDTSVPDAPEYYFQYFPSGCYSLCTQQLPDTLYGPPHVVFHAWDWLKNGLIDLHDTASIMAQYVATAAATYAWELDNGLCAKTSGDMQLSTANCNNCNSTSVTSTFTCDTANPACYSAAVTITLPPPPGATYTIGTNKGPVAPFTGALHPGTNTLSFSFTAIDTDATSLVLYVTVTMASGAKCMKRIAVTLPSCSWIGEKTSPGPSEGGVTAMLVYPNPAYQLVNISYDYGAENYGQRSISIYDPLGRKVGYADITDARGVWQVDTKAFVPGMYLVRMEGDGRVLHTQRLVVAN